MDIIQYFASLLPSTTVFPHAIKRAFHAVSVRFPEFDNGLKRMKPLKNQPYAKVLGEYLRMRRNQLHKSTSEVEEEAFIADKHLGRIERGEVEPYSSTLHKLIKVLHIDPRELHQTIDERMGWKND